jgi:hypothetical protein
MVRETYVMTYEADTPAQAGEKAMECMNEHPDQHILMQEMQFIPIDEEEPEWEESPQLKEIH